MSIRCYERGTCSGGWKFRGPKRQCSIETITDCVIVRVKSSDLRRYLSNKPELLMTCVQLLEDRERRLSRRVESLVFKDVGAWLKH